MTNHFVFTGAVGAVVVAMAASACSNSENDDVTPARDAGRDTSTEGDGGTGVPSGDGGGFALQPFTPPADPGGGGILFAASGEALALNGYPFPPAQAGDTAFVDGWDVKFTRLLVTIDNITLSSTPDKVPGDESQTGGVVAQAKGPWAVDLSRKDPSYLQGKGGPGELAVPLAALTAQSDGSPFLTDGTRYAFGFDVVAASAQAKNVNLADQAALEDYKAMIDGGCTALFVGHATFSGNKSDPACYPPGYEKWPDKVDFRFCFKAPTSYINCQNPDNQGPPFAEEENQRGLAFKMSGSVIAQVTIHTDHPFWDTTMHDAPMHFDQYAARVVGQGLDGGATPTVTLDLTKGVDYTAYSDALGNKLNWRYCTEPPTDVHAKFTGPMAFDPGSVPHATAGDPASGLRDYYDFATYNQSTEGHLNSDGLCYVRRGYPSPQ